MQPMHRCCLLVSSIKLCKRHCSSYSHYSCTLQTVHSKHSSAERLDNVKRCKLIGLPTSLTQADALSHIVDIVSGNTLQETFDIPCGGCHWTCWFCQGACQGGCRHLSWGTGRHAASCEVSHSWVGLQGDAPSPLHRKGASGRGACGVWPQGYRDPCACAASLPADTPLPCQSEDKIANVDAK